MNTSDLEDAIRELCDGAGLPPDDIAGVLSMLATGYQMLASEEAAEE